MKTDRKLLVAIIVLIVLVIWLLIISIQRSDQINKISKEVETLQTDAGKSTPLIQQPLNGKTPVLGVDYFNGVTGATGTTGRSVIGPQGPVGPPAAPGATGMSAYETAVKNGYVGTESEWLNSLKVKGDKGDAASELMIQCVQGLLSEKYQGDSFWQATNIKCETTSQ